ncbi:MAG: DUF126 domain-containing protein [Burkholderiaceae bacterium]
MSSAIEQTSFIECTAGLGRVCDGELLVSRHGFNARYDLDLNSGVFSRPQHDLYGLSPAGRILVFTGPKGGIATSWALDSLAQRGLAPLGLVCQQVNPVVVQGAALAGITLLAGYEARDLPRLASGARVRLDPRLRRIVLLD